MRAVLERFESGQTMAVLDELHPALAPGELKALRAAGIVRDTGTDGVVELSLSDLVRALRELYRAPGRGLVAWSELQATPMAVGVMDEADGGRWVYLVSGSRHGLEIVGMHELPTLALVFTADHVTRRQRERLAADAGVALEVLEESLTVRGGRLARRGASGVLRSARDDCKEEPRPEPAGTAPPPVRYPGASRWADVRIRIEDGQTMRIEHGPHVSRATPVDLGMAHAVTRKPTLLWEALQEFCDGHGTFRSRRFGNAAATKKTISRLGKELRRLFGLSESPFHPFTHGLGWSTRFVAGDRVSAEERRQR